MLSEFFKFFKNVDFEILLTIPKLAEDIQTSEKFLIEYYLGKDFIKFNSNTGWVNPNFQEHFI